MGSVPDRISELIEDPFFEEMMLRTDLAYFAERILNMEISGHHKRWSHLCAIEDRLAINAARDHGKSYFFSFAYAIWRSYFHWIPSKLRLGADFKSIPRISLGYIFSGTQDQAIKILEYVKREIESNPKLVHLLPARKETWSKMEIRLANGAMIRARGYGVSVRGAHPVWAVCDDVLTEENLYSELIRRKSIDYFYSAITPMVVPGGQIVVVGTPMHFQDLYGTLKENPHYCFEEFPALNATEDQALWPTRYTVDMLKRRKVEVGSSRFAREFLCVPVSDESSLFPEAIVRQCFDPQFEMPTYLTPEDRRKFQIYTGVDLAMSSTVGADYTVITTIGVDTFKNRWLLDIRRKRGMSMTEQLREIQSVHSAFKPSKIFIEDNAFQRVFRDELVRTTDLPVEGFTTTHHNKNDVERGVPSLQILFENKKFVLPRKTERDRKITDQLMAELRAFTWLDGKLQGVGAHDDMVMSLWIATECSNSSSFGFTFA